MRQTIKIFGVSFDLIIVPHRDAREKIGEAIGVEKFDELFERQVGGFFGVSLCTNPHARKEAFLVRAWAETAAKAFELLELATEREMGIRGF